MNYIINPINNKKVSIFSKQGKKILKNYVKNFKIYSLKGGMNTTEQEQINFSVMQFNIWQEGREYDEGFHEIALVIAEFKPDFVCISENRNFGFLPRLCEEITKIDNGLKYHHTSEEENTTTEEYGNTFHNDTSILSKHTIISDEKLIKYNRDDDCGSVTKITCNINGVGVCVYSIHLDWHFYIPYMTRGYSGSSPYEKLSKIPSNEEIVIESAKSKRLNQTKTIIQDANMEISRGNLVILGGDFNEAISTLETAQYNKVHQELKSRGFVDAYSEKWDIEGYQPNMGYTVNTNDSFNGIPTPDRIDFIFYKVPPTISVTNEDTFLIGPKFRGSLKDRNENPELFVDETDVSIREPLSLIPKQWSCQMCTFLNSLELSKCSMCDNEKPKTRWKCLKCTFENNSNSNVCSACNTKKYICNDSNRKNSDRIHPENQYILCWPSDHRAVFSNFSINPTLTTSTPLTSTTSTTTTSTPNETPIPTPTPTQNPTPPPTPTETPTETPEKSFDEWFASLGLEE